mgnify:CR=1 FL=1
MSFYEFLVNLAVKYRDNAFVKALFGKPYHYYLVYKAKQFHKREKANFKKYALDAISTLDECLTRNGFPYSLATGTLLGAVREKGFIPHDEDIDIFMWIEDYSPRLIDELSKVGIKLDHSYSIENDKLGKEDSFKYKGVQIDIFYIYPAIDDYPYFTDYFVFHDSPTKALSVKRHGGLMPRRLQLPIKKQFMRVPFECIELPICINAHEVLQFRYGLNYMIPNAKWMAGDFNPNVTEWPEKVGYITTY